MSLIGAPTDSHSSFLRGAAAAPAAIRAALNSSHSNMTAENGLEIGHDVLLEIVPDLPLTEGPGDFAAIQLASFECVSGGGVPLFLGGDHMITFPSVTGVVDALGPVDILHFDAHPDLYDDFDGDPLSHASPFARIMEQGLARRLVQVGIRTLNRHCREQAERFGVEIIEMRGFRPELVPIPAGPLYVTIDLDVLDPAHAPGVSHNEPGGMSVRELIGVLNRIDRRIVGADIVELNPSRDERGLTAIVAAKLVKEVAALAALPERASRS